MDKPETNQSKGKGSVGFIMEIISPDDFPPLGYDNTKRVAMVHQSILRDIRLKAHKINPDNYSLSELVDFVKFCLDKTS